LLPGAGFFFLPPHSDQLTHQSLVIWELDTLFQKESGWSIKLATKSRTEVSITVFPSFLGAKEARREGVLTNI
jgi:hypothetical protein